MATLKDVAKRAGVSIATASYCINNTKSVRQSTREKILQAAEELNYIPNQSAQSLRTDSSREIGVIFPCLDEFCHSEILKGIIFATESTKYTLEIAFTYNTPKLEQKIIDQFIGRQAAGLIIITSQPQNTSYFQNSLAGHNVPAVFIERFPEQIDANFLAFDNYKACYGLCRKLIEMGYREIVLLTGSEKYFSEYECIRGFTDAHDDTGLSFGANQIIQTNISKESGFQKAMLYLAQRPPQAVLTSSQSLARGVMEAFNLYSIKVPQRTCVITLGEECWNETDYLPNLIHTSRTAYTLGRRSVEVLLKNMESPQFFEKEFMLFQDELEDVILCLDHKSELESGTAVSGEPGQKSVPASPAKYVSNDHGAPRKLSILAPSLPTILSLSAVSGEFEKLHNVSISFDFVSYRELIDTITSHAKSRSYTYDIYLFDVSWLAYVANLEAFFDLTPILCKDDSFSRHLVKKNLENCCYKDRCWGFPIVGGTHLLFYRKDLFDHPTVQNQFMAQHNLPLRPPKTWTEFNGIAKFFTKKYNPYSPTRCGTSVTGSINEEFALEVFIRLWSYGGGLFDENGRLSLDTPQNRRGLQSLLDTCGYTENSFSDASIDKGFQDFGNGKTAMLISFTEYASHINDCIHGDIITNVGYAPLPGRTPANVGWHMGVSPQTEHIDLITDYFRWLCQKKTSYYMTILNGQSTIRHPYKNQEILKLYPWLHLNEELLNQAHSRVYPFLGTNRMIPPYETETILYDMFLKVQKNELSIPDALQWAQREIERCVSGFMPSH